LPQLGHAGCGFPPTSRIKSRIANIVAPQISWRLSSTQRDRLPSLGRRHRSRIKEAAVWHRELRFDHLSGQLVLIVQELHHFQRGWGGMIPRHFCHAHPLAAQEQQAPDTGQHYGGQQPSYYGSIPGHCHSSTVSNERLKFKRSFKTSASQKQGVFVDLNFFIRGTATSGDGVLRGFPS
jgi:hypothetical protein